MKFTFVLSHEELADLQTAIIVEMWDKVVGKGSSGSKRRRWLAEFSEKERKLLSYYYPIFYRWHLVKGIPQEHTFKKIENVRFIRRAVNFFASL